MRVLYIANELPPYRCYGGAGVHLGQLTSALRRTSPGIEMEFVCQGASEVPGVRANVHMVSLRRAGSASGALAAQLEWASRVVAMGLDFDIVHCHTWYSMLAGLMLRRVTGRPLVVTCHSLDIDRPWKREAIGDLYGYTTWVERAAYGEADAVVAVSERSRRRIEEAVRPGGEVRVIRNGVDHITSAEPVRPASIGEVGDGPYVLFVGRACEQKGAGPLLDAMALVERPATVVLCVGRPDSAADEERLGRAVSRLERLGGRALVLGEVSDRRELAWLYSHAAVFVCPSVYEPFGLTAVEAMSCGAPTVMSDAAGASELVVDGEDAIVVPLGDSGPAGYGAGAYVDRLAGAIDRVLGDDELRGKLSANAPDRMRRAPVWDDVAREHAALYRHLAGRDGARW